MIVDPDIYTVPEAAKVLRVSTWLVYKLIGEGKLPHLRLGERRIVVPKVAIERMCEADA